MITNELRLGNYIYRTSRNSEVHLPIEIPLHISKIGIFECEVEGLAITNHPPFTVQANDIAVIPITGKILERCGFIPSHFGYSKGDDFHYQNKGIIIGGSDADNKYWRNLSVQVDVLYLHQLQNIYYAVTGLELDVNTENWLKGNQSI